MSSTEADNIDELYKNYDILNDAKDKISEEHRVIIEAVKSSQKDKRLASQLVQLAVEQAELDTDEKPLIIEDEHVERYILCATQSLPYFSAQVEATPFIKFACEKLFSLRAWKLIGANDSDRDQQHLRVLKVFAEMSAFCGTLDAPSLKIDAIFNVLQEYMPLPPITEGDATIDKKPSFKFSHAECLLYALLKLGKQNIDYFQFKDNPNKLKEFRSYLKYLDRGTQENIKKLEDAILSKLPKKSDDEATRNERRIKLIALKTTSNVSTLIRNLFHSPPIFHSLIQLSWITKKNNRLDKRHAPITFQSDTNNDEKRKKVGAKSMTSDRPSEDIPDASVLPNDLGRMQEQRSLLQVQIDDLRLQLVGQVNLNADLQEQIVDLQTRVNVLENRGSLCTCGAMNVF